jgi:hypothetical protein
MNRILIVSGKEYDVKYTNRAKSTLEGLENKSVMEVVSYVFSNASNIKIDTCVNIVYAGIKHTEEGKNITRDMLYDILPDNNLDMSKLTFEFFNVLIEDIGIKKAIKDKGEKEGN